MLTPEHLRWTFRTDHTVKHVPLCMSGMNYPILFVFSHLCVQ